MFRKLITALYISVVLSSSVPALAEETDLAYFRQFLYHKEVYGPDPDFPLIQYRYLMNEYPSTYQADDGSKVRVSSRLYLNESGTYDLIYEEWVPVGEPRPDGSQPMISKGCRHVKGNWSVPSTDLLLEEPGTRLGAGTRAFKDNQHSVQIVFSRNILMPGLKDKPILFVYGYSKNTMDEDVKFCFPW